MDTNKEEVEVEATVVEADTRVSFLSSPNIDPSSIKKQTNNKVVVEATVEVDTKRSR